MTDGIIERATKIANKGVQKDDGYRYSVPASDLAEYAAVIHELVAELTRRAEARDQAWASYQAEHGYTTYPTQPDTGADFAAGFDAGAAVSLEGVKAETVIDSLDRVATGTVIRDSRGFVFQSLGGNWLRPGDSTAWPTLPAVVLWRPAPAEGVEK